MADGHNDAAGLFANLCIFAQVLVYLVVGTHAGVSFTKTTYRAISPLL